MSSLGRFWGGFAAAAKFFKEWEEVEIMEART
jgi:hypothetical protein